MERDANVGNRKGRQDHFNSHAHVERDDRAKGQLVISSTNFNSHAHVERDEIRAIILLALSISTHTLTWSVTVGSWS